MSVATRKSVSYRLKGGGITRDLLVSDDLCECAAKTVLAGEYPPILESGVRTIIDAGANVGAAAILFAAYHPEAQIKCYEPCLDVYELLEENVSHLPQVTCYPRGLWSSDTTLSLFDGYSSVQNSVYSQPGHQSGEQRDVACSDALSVIQSDVDILKLDVEGSEIVILERIQSVLNKVAVVYLETHCPQHRLDMERLLTPTHMLVGANARSASVGLWTWLNKAETDAATGDWWEL